MPKTNTPMNSSEEYTVYQYLTFMLGGQEYAVSLVKVKEIIEYHTVTPVPGTPEWVRGVINLRGSVVPVIDLAVKFQRPMCRVGKLTCIIIMEVHDGEESSVMGVIADSVSQVIELKPDEIESSPKFGTNIKVEYLVGMAAAGARFSLILDTDKILSTDELLNLSISAQAETSDNKSDLSSTIGGPRQ